jgi:hypothetical protein
VSPRGTGSVTPTLAAGPGITGPPDRPRDGALRYRRCGVRLLFIVVLLVLGHALAVSTGFPRG